jgi:TonB-dependent SusC/RagA subfamily outer membrane receptor
MMGQKIFFRLALSAILVMAFMPSYAQKSPSSDYKPKKTVSVKKDKVDGADVQEFIAENNSTKALYIVNGKIVESLDTVDVNSIQTIEVLKGGDAVLVYGKRGENGVILITLKKQ